MVDQRDATTWVALELTRQGELKVEDGSLARELRSALGVEDDWPVFIPAKVYSKGGKKITVHLMEGYAFVATGLDEVQYFALEQEGKLVERVMTSRSPSGMRVLSTIPERQIASLRRQLQDHVSSDIERGMEVRVKDGKYKGLEGVVTWVDLDHAMVFITLRSLETVARIPRAFLDCSTDIDDDDESEGTSGN